MPVKMLQQKSRTWLLLLYALPTNRTSARVSLWRKLKRFGSLQLKTSAYVLPDDPEQYERFQWLSEEIESAGGDASVLRVTEIKGMDEATLIQMFNRARETDYEELTRTIRKLTTKDCEGHDLNGDLKKLQNRYNEIREVDYFKAPQADDAQRALGRLERLMGSRRKVHPRHRLSREQFQGKLWQTRPRPGIDRAGSAWLIRNFIDAKARFAFSTEPSQRGNVIPFDMADVEFSHHGDDCTFETLAKRFGIRGKAVLQLAEMVHDADLEDGKFQRCECIGINALMSGWGRTGMSDADLLRKGMECFEALYQHIQKTK